MSGVVVQDTVSLGPFSVPGVNFLLVEKATGLDVESKFDGVLGLALPLKYKVGGQGHTSPRTETFIHVKGPYVQVIVPPPSFTRI